LAALVQRVEVPHHVQRLRADRPGGPQDDQPPRPPLTRPPPRLDAGAHRRRRLGRRGTGWRRRGHASGLIRVRSLALSLRRKAYSVRGFAPAAGAGADAAGAGWGFFGSPPPPLPPVPFSPLLPPPAA